MTVKVTDITMQLSGSVETCSALLSLDSLSVCLNESSRVSRVPPAPPDPPDEQTLRSLSQNRSKSAYCLSEMGKFVLIPGKKINGKLECLLFSGPENRTGLDILLPQNENPSEKILRLSVQFPYDFNNQKLPVVFTFGVQKTSFLFDPSLMAVLSYCPRKILSRRSYDRYVSKRMSEVRSVSHRHASGGSASETGGTTRRGGSRGGSSTTSEVKTSKAGQSNVTPFLPPLATTDASSSSSWKHQISDWCSVLQRLLVHIDVQGCSVFLPGSPLNIRCDLIVVKKIQSSIII